MNSHSKWSNALDCSAYLLSGIVISLLIGCTAGANSAPAPQGKLSLSSQSNELKSGQSTTLALSDTASLPASITWSLSCGSASGVICGGLSDNGTTYTAPASPPVGNEATITASAGNGETTSIVIALDNPTAVITSVSPSLLNPAVSSQIKITGSGFVPGSIIQLQSGQATLGDIAVLSPTEITANLDVPVYASGNLSVTVQNPNPGTTTSAPGFINISNGPVSYEAAVRFLKQATFGPTPVLIAHVQQIGLSEFIDEQFAAPISLQSFDEWGDTDESPSDACSMMFNAVNGPDQLRQRVSFALSQIIVTSGVGSKVYPEAIAPWEDILQNDAFATYAQLLSDAIQNFAVSSYLDNSNNLVSSPTQHASQNLGRELLQLFTVGPYLLNIDGSLQPDSNGQPIPTYSPIIIDGVSRALTGWKLAYLPGPQGQNNNAEPLVPVNWGHDQTAKQLLNGLVTTPGRDPQQDLQTLVANIALHQNIAPFVSRRLIQALVTSNPSPDYIARIAHVFVNDGTGLGGNLQAVVKAILLDPEARAGDSSAEDASFGHIQEPFLYAAGVLRATGAQIGGVGPESTRYTCDPDANIIETWLVSAGQEPFLAPSVFNFYQFNNMLPGSNLYAPEMQIMNATTSFARLNFLNDLLFGSSALSKDILQDQHWQADAKQNPDQLVADLSNLMVGQSLDSVTSGAISAAVSAIPSTNAEARVRQAFYLIAASGQYQVIH